MHIAGTTIIFQNDQNNREVWPRGWILQEVMCLCVRGKQVRFYISALTSLISWCGVFSFFFVPLSFASFLFIFSITLQICFAHPSEYLAVYKTVKIDYHFFNILDNYRNMLEMIQFGWINTDTLLHCCAVSRGVPSCVLHAAKVRFNSGEGRRPFPPLVSLNKSKQSQVLCAPCFLPLKLSNVLDFTQG